jgi:hypothetical protein
MNYEVLDVVRARDGSIGFVQEITDNGDASVVWFLNATETKMAWWAPGKLQIVDNITFALGRGFNYHGSSSDYLRKGFGKRFDTQTTR